MKNHPVLPSLIILLIAVCCSCSKEYSASGFTKTTTTPVEDSFNLTINFRPMVDTVKLSFDSTYRNFWKEEYKVSAFKFYVSNFSLINTDSGRAYHLDTGKVFLVDAADSTTWSVKLLAQPFIYNRISFLIGVDSLHNISGAKTGALDPAKGMYWTPSAGYIMAKLEGSGKDNNFAYNIGGFSGDYNVLRKPTLLFPFEQYLQISKTAGAKWVININANVNSWFYNPHQIKIATNPTCTSPGLMAKDISENYSNMFSVDTVINN